MNERPHILTIRIGGSLWSFGYVWQTATSAASLKHDAQTEASLKNVAADVVALRHDSTHPQFGLGHLAPDDRKKGMVAAHAFATQLAKQTIRSAIGLFALPDAYWVVIVDSDLIPTYGDRVFTSLAEALAAFEEHLYEKQAFERHWRRIYLPKSLLDAAPERMLQTDDESAQSGMLDQFLRENFGRISTTSLLEVLRDAKAPAHRQRRVRRNDIDAIMVSKPALAAYACIAVCLLIVYGAVPRLRPPIAPAALTQVKQPPHDLAILAPPPEQINSPAPSANAPRAGDILRSCFYQFSMLDDNLPWGWEDGALTCHGHGASLIVHRHGGTPDQLEAAFASAGIAFEPNYDNGTVTVSAALPPVRAPQSLDHPDILRRRLYGISWQIREPITVDLFAPPPARAAADKAIWRQANFIIASDTDPLPWASLLDELPGVTITSVSLNARQMRASPMDVTWEIRGVAYAQ